VVTVRDAGKKNVLGVLVDAVDYEAVVSRAMSAAAERRSCSITALAVHGVMTGVFDPIQRFRLNNLDIVTPDGQPVRWALNLLHGVALRDRVYGPSLMLSLCQSAAERRYPIYLYGSSADVLDRMVARLPQHVPGLVIAGWEPSRFRRTTEGERRGTADRIKGSGARLTFVGLGCPRQEIFAHEYRDILGMPLVSVGAAFPYFAGVRREPPAFVQKAGLQWLYRMGQEPTRLWRRYLVLNPVFAALLLLQAVGAWKPDPGDVEVPRDKELVG
jgi:N-acetylglucosaminyldiphosphoundecaprenol N-acetyl-beta-D-mannosaminyltransferase